jgi:hypothetical protein
MSDFRAVATVTAALQRLLQSAVGTDVPGAHAWTDRPDSHQNGDGTGPGVNIYLYQVTPEPSRRNADLPTRGSNGQPVRRPQAALTLHYLLSFYGDDGELEPQRVLGSTVRTLHARPVITRALIQAVTDAAVETPPIHPDLAGSDLADQADVVRVSPLALNLEELSKLWSVFFQVPYALSVAYQASVVLIEEPVPTVGGVPVLRPDLTVGVLRGPRVTRVDAVSGELITAADILAVHGARLAGATTTVQIGPHVVAPTSTAPDLLTITLSTMADLRAGRTPLKVLHSPLGEESDVASFTMHPTVTAVAVGGTAAAGDISVTTDLTVGAGQTVALSLLAPETGERLRVYPAPARDTDTTTVTVPVSGMTPGRYIVQLSVDGADSDLERDAQGQLTGPEVTLP